jgi:hypothetical protein
VVSAVSVGIAHRVIAADLAVDVDLVDVAPAAAEAVVLDAVHRHLLPLLRQLPSSPWSAPFESTNLFFP